MRFSLLTLMAFAFLAALLAGGIALSFQVAKLKAKRIELSEQATFFRRAHKDPEATKEYCDRFFGSFEKQSNELKIANEKYLELARTMRPLKIVDQTKLSMIQIPDASWDRPEVDRIGWRVFVPGPKSDAGRLQLAVDFVPQMKDHSGSRGDKAKILKESQYFTPWTSQRFELPVGEFELYFETEGVGKTRKIKILVNENCIHEMKLTHECNGWGQSVLASQTQQVDIEVGKPYSLLRWTPSLPTAAATETCWLRILPAMPSTERASK